MRIAKEKVLFDTICHAYDSYRKADPYITKKLIELLQPEKDGLFLDLACGTGNYTGALHQAGIKIEGVDNSEHMLQQAKEKFPNIRWLLSGAQKLPFENNYFNGGICILAIHHMSDLDEVFKELARTISSGRFVIFIHTPLQLKNYWLNEYFPKMMAQSIAKSITLDNLNQMLINAGFSEVIEEKYFIQDGLEDLFLHAGKYRPELYLDEAVRAGISTFQLAPDPVEITEGIKQLTLDIKNRQIKEIIKKYNSDVGDYSFIIASKC